ncbi:MAG: GNAT family N-acetyltransferase [Bacteroides sp.]|nr:GNAT family N-acetyltransferase [Bacteroides sp.]
MIQFTLRKFRFSDAESLRKHADNERVARFLTNQFPHPYSLRDAEEFITCVMNDNPAKIFAIVINEEVAGSIGITP